MGVGGSVLLRFGNGGSEMALSRETNKDLARCDGMAALGADGMVGPVFLIEPCNCAAELFTDSSPPASVFCLLIFS